MVKTGKKARVKTALLKILIILSFGLASLSTMAQTMSISSFRLDETDQTAIMTPTMKLDLNGEKCALIKIITTQKDFSFDVGSLGVTDIEWQNTKHPGEIWLYVPNGVMKISIQHPLFGTIKDYDLGSRLKKGSTYVMELTSDQVNTLVVDYDKTRTLDIEVFPKSATFYLNGLKQALNSQGRASISLACGVHKYRVEADNYHLEESQITIEEGKGKQTLSVRLKQAYGYLNINSTPESAGGQAYLDDKPIGKLPIVQYPVKSGSHKLVVHQKLYLPYTEKVHITDSTVTTISPRLNPNYSKCDIIVDGDNEAKLYDNGEFIGQGRWSGRLEAGEHIIEAKKSSHTTVSQKVTIVKDIPRKISLAKPLPIYGRLEIKTQPNKAEVYLDGQSVSSGRTAYFNNQLLIGKHHVKLSLAGHKTEEFDVDIKENQTTHIEKKLTNYCEAVIYSKPLAYVYIDGKYEGLTPTRIHRVAGNYNITVSTHGYSSYSKRMYLDGNTKDITITLRRDYIRPNEMYIQLGGVICGMTGLNAGLGTYIRNVNIECNYILGLSKSETIYWNDKSGETYPYTATYKPSGCNFKIGYGFRLHNRIRFTPQIGGQFIKLKESEAENYGEYYYSTVADGSSAASLTFGLRCNVVLTSHVGLSVSPEYMVGISKSDKFKLLSDVSSKIKGYADGFNCNINFNVFF